VRNHSWLGRERSVNKEMSKKELTLKQLARWFYNHEPRDDDHFESKWNHFLAQEPYWKDFIENSKRSKKKTKIKAVIWKDEIEPLDKSFESLNLIKITPRKNQIPAKIVHYHKMSSMPFIYIHGYFLNEGMNGAPKFPAETLNYRYRKKVENYTYTCNQCGTTQEYDKMIRRFHDSGHDPKELHCTQCGAYDWNEKGTEHFDKNNEKQRERGV